MEKKPHWDSAMLFQGHIPPSVSAGKAQHEGGSLERASHHKGIKHSKTFKKLKSKRGNLSATKKKEKKLFEWNIIPSFHAPAQTNDSGLCIVVGTLVSVQLRDSYFDEGISKCQGFSRNTLRRGGKKHERNAKSFSIQAMGEEHFSCVCL